MGCDNNMSKLKGKFFKLYAKISGEFVPVSALRSTTMLINNDQIDVTDKDGTLWKTLLEGAGIQSASIKASGMCNNSASFAFIRTNAITGALVTMRIESNIYDIYAGVFKITSMESSGDYNKEEIFSLSLYSRGAFSHVIPEFRLLEDGGYRLLEDGSRRLLEAA